MIITGVHQRPGGSGGIHSASDEGHICARNVANRVGGDSREDSTQSQGGCDTIITSADASE